MSVNHTVMEHPNDFARALRVSRDVPNLVIAVQSQDRQDSMDSFNTFFLLSRLQVLSPLEVPSNTVLNAFQSGFLRAVEARTCLTEFM